MFLAIDGIDGAGKTTLVNHLAVLLQSLSPVITKEPTKNSKWGQRLRRAAIEGRLPLQQEIEYFHKDRLNHIENVIAPALDQDQRTRERLLLLVEDVLEQLLRDRRRLVGLVDAEHLAGELPEL